MLARPDAGVLRVHAFRVGIINSEGQQKASLTLRRRLRDNSPRLFESQILDSPFGAMGDDFNTEAQSHREVVGRAGDCASYFYLHLYTVKLGGWQGVINIFLPWGQTPWKKRPTSSLCLCASVSLC